VSLSVNQRIVETHERRSSPFTPALRVKPTHQEVDEQILYHIERRSDDIISWVDDPGEQWRDLVAAVYSRYRFRATTDTARPGR